MAKVKLPDALARRHLVERDLPQVQALRIAEGYLAQGRAWDAIAFLAKAGARERLEALREEAMREGDAFLLKEVSRALGEEPGPARWQALAEAARRLGKDRYAKEAERQARRGGE